MLNDDQFEGLAKQVNTEGGFSVRAYGPRTGTSPRNVNMVGLPEHNEPVSAPTTAATVKSYAESRRGALSQPNMSMGGWHDTHIGRIDLDVSREFPRTKRGHVEARRATISGAQKAYGEIDEAGEYTEHRAPMAKIKGGRQVAFHSRANQSWVYDPIRKRR